MDVKPLNILMELVKGPDGKESLKCVISDFGCANVLGNQLNSSRIIKGLEQPNTSPELLLRIKTLRSNTQEIDKKIDVYAYAITLFEMLIRGRAWGESTARQVAEAVAKTERPVVPDTLAATGSETAFLVQLVQACWAHFPFERPSFTLILESLKAGAILTRPSAIAKV